MNGTAPPAPPCLLTAAALVVMVAATAAAATTAADAPGSSSSPLLPDAFAQRIQGFGNSPFEREFGDVKFLDAYFGTADEKIEVGAGDKNVPFTVVMANVGTQDITGIRGQLGLSTHFSPADGPGAVIHADAVSNSPAGENFALTFFINVDEHAPLQQYPGTVKVDYSRLRESGTRTAFFDFEFKLTGDSIINMRAADPFLVSLQENTVVIEVSNDGTAPVSDVELELQNTQTAISSMSTSVTNIENVVILDSNWEVGHINPGESKFLELLVYVPESLRGESLRMPMTVTYFNAHGDVRTINRVVDFFVQGLIDLTVYDVEARNISERQLILGEIINEGNEAGLFAFVTLTPLGDSNIKESRQFIDEIETDSPVPFNIPIEFEEDPVYGSHDIQITVRYKDNLRAERFEIHQATVLVEEPVSEDAGIDENTFFMVLIAAGAGITITLALYARKRKRGGRQAGD